MRPSDEVSFKCCNGRRSEISEAKTRMTAHFQHVMHIYGGGRPQSEPFSPQLPLQVSVLFLVDKVVLFRWFDRPR